MKWWVYIALKQLFPSGKFVSLFALISVFGVSLGVLALFGTQSVMNGFHHKIAEKIIDVSGEVMIRTGGRIMYEDQIAPVVEKLSQDPRIKKIERVASGPVVMQYNNTQAFPMLRSYDTIANDSVIPIREKGFVRNCSIDDLDDDGVIISGGIANQIGVGLGDIVEVLVPSMLDKFSKDEIPLPIKLKVIGFFKSGFSTFDENAAIVSLRRMQDFYGMPGGIHMLALKLNDGADPASVAANINKMGLPNYGIAYTWDTGVDLMQMVIMEKMMMSIIIMLIILVASFSICSSLYTSVLRKTKEIGLQAAMGARGWEIAASYCLQGFIIGVLGAIVGLCFTFLILHFRDPIVTAIVGQANLNKFYFFTRLPVKYDFWDGFVACSFAVLLCTLAGFLPALRASRLKASEAMRNE